MAGLCDEHLSTSRWLCGVAAVERRNHRVRHPSTHTPLTNKEKMFRACDSEFQLDNSADMQTQCKITGACFSKVESFRCGVSAASKKESTKRVPLQEF